MQKIMEDVTKNLINIEKTCLHLDGWFELCYAKATLIRAAV